MPTIIRPRFLAAAAAAVAAFVAGCSSQHTPLDSVPVAGSPSVPSASQAPADQDTAQYRTSRLSQAATPRAYRADAASHIYAQNRERIWQGKLPPLLYAIGVLQVEVDHRGNVRSLHWMRAPSHPEVVSEIERTVRAAAPFPAPARMGKVVYTDTWLWHKSGQFQLDTLTEGQL